MGNPETKGRTGMEERSPTSDASVSLFWPKELRVDLQDLGLGSRGVGLEATSRKTAKTGEMPSGGRDRFKQIATTA